MYVKNMTKRFVFLLIASANLAFSLSANATLNIQHWQTAAGSEVYFVENHDLPIIDVSANFAAGSARDTQEKSGLAGITKYMMTLGADGMSDEVISNKLADIGAILAGDFDADRASFKLRSLSSKPEQTQALYIFNAILHKPDFPDAVLAREKGRIISSIQESATQPESISNKAFMSALYGQHPYALDESGEPETVASIKPYDLKAFYKTHYTSRGAVIALIGDMTQAQAHDIADNISSGLPQSPAVAKLASVTLPTRANVQWIAHPASQSHILLGYPGIKRGDADLFPLYVGNYILGGGGFVSRLTEEVREKRGLVYSVYSYFMPMSDLGPFKIGLQTKREQSAEALKLVRETLAKFIAGGVTEKELDAAKQNIIGGFPMRIDSNSKILDYLSVIGFYKLPLDYLETYNAQIAKVTTAQIKDAFARRIKPDSFVTIVVGGDAK